MSRITIPSATVIGRIISDLSGSRNLVIQAMMWISLLWLVPAAIAGAAPDGPKDFSWADIFIGLAGGLAFFLYGMEKMSNGMKNTAGNKMRTILASLTKNRVIALIVGAFVTMVIQSSSATTVMLVSFVQAGLLNLDISKAVEELNWSPVYDTERTLDETVRWYRQLFDDHGIDTARLCHGQIVQYVEDARSAGQDWTEGRG